MDRQRDEDRVKIELDPKTALRALLKVDPDAEPPDDSPDRDSSDRPADDAPSASS